MNTSTRGDVPALKHRRKHVRAIEVGGTGALEALRQIDAKITALAVQQ